MLKIPRNMYETWIVTILFFHTFSLHLDASRVSVQPTILVRGFSIGFPGSLNIQRNLR